MSQTHVLKRGGPSARTTPERLSLFQRIADKVSYGMGTPTNIFLWVLAVGAWIALGPYIAHHNFMPAWFTSNSLVMPHLGDPRVPFWSNDIAVIPYMNG